MEAKDRVCAVLLYSGKMGRGPLPISISNKIISIILSNFSEIYWNLLIARGLAGIAVGIIHFLIPIYIDDISTAEQKPTFNCIIQMQFAFGILSQFVLGEFSILNYL